MNTKDVKILAPAGSFASLNSALNAGTDEVFFGISDFNMRASASVNFKKEDLSEIVKLCKVRNVKTNLTLNTLMYDSDLERMREMVDLAEKSGIDAIIAADIATIQYAQDRNLEVHISTQLSVSNIESVKFFAKYSDRIVLARELTLEQVKEICDLIKKERIKGPKGNLIEIEVFAHGALCVAVSGRCSMSLYSYNKSANRGKCTQVCRRSYKITDESTGKELIIDNNYVMSSADLCTIGMLPELVGSGVTVLKFEGRGRSPEYVDRVIRVYREALDSLSDDIYTQEQVERWNQELGMVFNRGTTQGFYMGRKEDEWAGLSGNKSAQEKIFIGKVKRYYPKIKVAEVVIKARESINSSDEFLIIGQSTGVIRGNLNGMKVDEKNGVEEASQGDVITFEIQSKPRVGDQFFVVRERESLIPKGRDKSTTNV